MKYLVIELQTSASGVANIVYDFSDRNEAESKYHYVLSFAAVSNLPCHSATLMTNEGFVLESKCYKHEGAAQAQTTPEAE